MSPGHAGTQKNHCAIPYFTLCDLAHAFPQMSVMGHAYKVDGGALYYEVAASEWFEHMKHGIDSPGAAAATKQPTSA